MALAPALSQPRGPLPTYPEHPHPPPPSPPHHRYAAIDRALWTDTRRLIRARQLCDTCFAAFVWDCARDRRFVPQPKLAVAAPTMTMVAVSTTTEGVSVAAEADDNQDAIASSAEISLAHPHSHPSGLATGRPIIHLDRDDTNADADSDAGCDPTLVTLQTGARFVFGTLCRARVGRGKPLRQWLDHLSVAVTLHTPFCVWLITEAAARRHEGHRTWIECTLIDCPDAETREAFAKLFLNAALCLRYGRSQARQSEHAKMANIS